MQKLEVAVRRFDPTRTVVITTRSTGNNVPVGFSLQYPKLRLVVDLTENYSRFTFEDAGKQTFRSRGDSVSSGEIESGLQTVDGIRKKITPPPPPEAHSPLGTVFYN